MHGLFRCNVSHLVSSCVTYLWCGVWHVHGVLMLTMLYAIRVLSISTSFVNAGLNAVFWMFWSTRIRILRSQTCWKSTLRWFVLTRLILSWHYFRGRLQPGWDDWYVIDWSSSFDLVQNCNHQSKDAWAAYIIMVDLVLQYRSKLD